MGSDSDFEDRLVIVEDEDEPEVQLSKNESDGENESDSEYEDRLMIAEDQEEPEVQLSRNESGVENESDSDFERRSVIVEDQEETEVQLSKNESGDGIESESDSEDSSESDEDEDEVVIVTALVTRRTKLSRVLPLLLVLNRRRSYGARAKQSRYIIPRGEREHFALFAEECDVFTALNRAVTYGFDAVKF
ncbi:hypothetical protein DICVIV_06796 [Dictyocaulus viviparus]|uniref:Uncharacterized protein n=1 Tax=Dictyocaulus viviparus TaxID=29172 RepID=A0A0D8XRJ4_DICVI|nr:hypothetical protein DICVIV_06796 [Dictyocaulus viviparus]